MQGSRNILYEAKDDAAGVSFEKNGVKEWVPIFMTNYGKELSVKELERCKRIARGQQRLGNPVRLARNPTEIPRNPEIQKSNLRILIVNVLYTIITTCACAIRDVCTAILPRLELNLPRFLGNLHCVKLIFALVGVAVAVGKHICVRVVLVKRVAVAS